MFDPTFIPILGAAQREPWEQLRDTMRWSDSSPAVPLLWAAVALGCVLALVVLVMWILDRRKKGQLLSGPMLLFHKLAGEFGVSLADQWLLMRIARLENLPTPLVLITSPGTLRHYSEKYLAKVNPLRRNRVQARLAQIHWTLFVDAAAPADTR